MASADAGASASASGSGTGDRASLVPVPGISLVIVDNLVHLGPSSDMLRMCARREKVTRDRRERIIYIASNK